jgi:hypothetical protein
MNGMSMAMMGILMWFRGKGELKPVDPTFFQTLSLESIAIAEVFRCYIYQSACG